MNEQEQQEFNELRQSLRIDIHALHKDAQAQPDLVFRAGELAAEAKARARRARAGLEEMRADVDKRIRDEPEAFGLAKITEGSVESAVTRCAEVVQARIKLIEAEQLADRTAALAEAFRHKKAMISDEVQLYLSNYFGEVSERQMKQAESDGRGQQETRVLDKRKRRRKLDGG